MSGDLLREMMERMRGVVEGVGWLGYGLPRENIIEPQLGYALRYLELKLQRGLGCGHSLVGSLAPRNDSQVFAADSFTRRGKARRADDQVCVQASDDEDV